MEIPSVGLGFWQISKADAAGVLKVGLDAGYRHIDTAIAYDNEMEIGEGLKQCAITREELFITSKIPAEIKSYEKAKEAIKQSIERLGCGYLDLMLIHAPKPWALMMLPTPRYHKGNLKVWKALVEAKKEGLVREIGVSNFNINDLKNIQKNSDEKIYANQIRVHIGHVDKKLIDYCKENNIIVEGYSPNGTGRMIKREDIKEIANRYNVSSAQLSIKYDMQKGVIPLPRSHTPTHIIENFDLNFEISLEDMEKLDKMIAF